MAKTAIDKKEERLIEWRKWIETYLETDGIGDKCETIPHAAELLNLYYWRLANQFIKPLLLQEGEESHGHNIHYYKIISASELTVMAVLPFVFKESAPHEERLLINAEFAFFIASSIMLNWKIAEKELIDIEDLEKVVLHKELIDIKAGTEKQLYPDNFRDEHIDWLRELNINGPLPIIINSQVWRLCCHACMAIRNGGKLL